VLHGFSTGVPSKTAPGASLLGEPPHADQLSTQVRDYRNTLNAANADLTAQLKAARQTLKDARQSGDQEAITAAQASVDGINVQLQANHDSLSKIHGDVKDLRELRQQLTTDVKTGNVDAIAQDRVAIAEQRQHVLADLQA
jgi:ABC-type amino acid transport substrate-binding protein